MAVQTYTLLVQLGPGQGEAYPISGDEFVLGRDPSSQLVVEDVEISRRHARLLAQSGGYAIEDLGSTNGTFVNGKRIRTVVPLEPGATIRLGENVLLYFDLAAEAAAPREEETVTMHTPPQGIPSQPEAPRVELVETLEKEEKPAPKMEVPPAAPPKSAQTTEAKEPESEMPFYRRPVAIGIGAALVLGICALTAFLWYVDANYLWCDVFGNMIAACR